MGRKKKHEEDKAVSFSVTLPPMLYKELELSRGERTRARAVRESLQWFWELLSVAGLQVENRFCVNEIQAILANFKKITAKIGEVGQLKRQFASLFYSTDLNSEGLHTKKALNKVQEEYGLELHEIRTKLRQLTELEVVWLYINCEKLIFAEEKTGQEPQKEQIKYIFRCQ